MKDKTEDMSEIITDILSFSPECEGQVGLDIESALKQEYPELLARIKSLLSSLPPSGAASEATVTAELLYALKYLIDVREIECKHSHPAPDHSCAKCIADKAISRAEALHED